MNHHNHLTLAAVIWPGPVNGPHPFTLFKILTPVLIIWLGVIPATIAMAFLVTGLSLYFYEVIMLEGSFDMLNRWVGKLPDTFEKALKVGTARSLIPLVLLTGPFPLAISFRFLDYPRTRARIYLVLGSFANALIWTGIVWGGGLSILKAFIDNISLF